MTKLFGAVCVTLASLLAGWHARRGLSDELGLLRQLRLALELMQGEMELSLPPLPELFRGVGRRMDGAVGEFFQGTGEKMAAVTGRPPAMAMKIQMEQQELPLGREEKAMVLELGGALGRYDLNGQARALGLYRDRLDRRILTLEQVEKQKARAWMSASVCSGIMLVLLML